MSATTSRHLSFVVLVLAFLCLSGAATAARPLQGAPPPGEVVHLPPVEAAVLDPFRAPPEPWLAGNRGIEYETAPGDIIRASAPGVVTFAGVVAGDRHVTIRHSVELVTTAAFVGDVLVAEGDRVVAGDPIAIAAGPFHFTARLRGRYIDPMGLFRPARYAVRLVPIR